MVIMDQSLKKIQEQELEILEVVDRFCRDNQIDYSLAYGTLIGAVRHKGFIPWDDDIDLMMKREDYDRFIQTWQDNPPKGYFLQTDITDPEYGNNFLKIRKDGTTFIQDESEKSCSYHTGIFIDIFPFDRVAPEGIQRKMQYLFCQFSMLMTRNHKSGKKGLSGIVETVLLGMPKIMKKKLKETSYNQKTKWNRSSSDNLLYFSNGTIHGSNTYFEPDLFDQYTELPFEGRLFKVISRYDKYLKDYFGDYMQLPPENERLTHHPLVVDFEKEYSEIKKEGEGNNA